MLRITFLGTGTSQGIPIIGSNHPVCLSPNPKDKRLRVSILIQWDNHNYVVDCGPDFRQQMLQANVNSLDGILFTHEHADHTAGIDDVRPFSFKQGAVNFYAEKRVFRELSIRFDYVFRTENKYPGAPTINSHTITENNPFPIKDKMVTPIRVMHHDIPVMGFRIDDFAYLTDVKTITALEMDKLGQLDTLVINALRIEPHRSHLNLEEALEMVKKINPKKCYITHISHHLGFHDEVTKQLPSHVHLAYDGLSISTN